MSLLEKGRITIHAAYYSEADGVRISLPLIFLAVACVREQVVRALVRLGASIDSFRVLRNGDSASPTGEAIRMSNIPALSLCLRLGAKLFSVHRPVESPPTLRSSNIYGRTTLEVAIGQAKPPPLIYLLDEVYTARHVRLAEELAALVTLASRAILPRFAMKY